MFDGQGRNIDYIRISVTDRCNLRCRYCMPEEGVEQIGHDAIIRDDEILRLVRLFGKLGITRIKLTGGEPLVRKGLSSLVEDIKGTEGIEQVTMTSNGILLGENLESLVSAGLDGINISLDTLSPDIYSEITRREGLDKVLESIEKCGAFPQLRVKINVVTLADYNMDEVEVLAELARDRDMDVRFIELMPLGLGRDFKGFGQEFIMERLTEVFGEPVICEESHGNGPAVYYKFSGFKGSVGFISALSHTFCGSCNRVRLTSQGILKPCLHFEKGTDILSLMRTGAGDEELLEIIEKTIYSKPSGHEFILAESPGAEQKLMSQIGG